MSAKPTPMSVKQPVAQPDDADALRLGVRVRAYCAIRSVSRERQALSMVGDESGPAMRPRR